MTVLPLIKRKIYNLIHDEKFSEILTGSAWALGARVFATLFALLTSVIIARIYGAEMMGIVAFINSFVAISTIFTLLGTNTSILRMIPEHVARYSVSSAYRIYRKTQCFVCGVSILIGAALFATAPFMARTILSKPHLAFYLALSAAFIWARSLMDLNTQAVRGLRLIRTFAFMLVSPHFMMALFLGLATLCFKEPNAPVYAQVAAWVLTALLGAAIMEAAFRVRMQPTGLLKRIPLKAILSLASPMLVSSSMMFLLANTGMVVLGALRSEEEVGYYSAAVKLATLNSLILNSINSIAAPKFSELFHAGKTEDLFHVARKSSKLIFWVTLPILFALICFGQHILAVFFGPAFKAAYPALALLTLGEFINSASGSTAFFMNMTGHEKALRNIVSTSAGLNVLANLVLVPKLGILGSALATSTTTALWNLSVILYIKTKYQKTIGYFPRLGL